MPAIIQGVSRQTNVSRPSEGTNVYLKLIRDGSVQIADIIATLCLEGRVFCGNLGTITGPATFGAASIEPTEFDFHISVPASLVVLPLELRIQMEVFGTSQVFESMAAYGTGSAPHATSTTVTPVNMNTNSARLSGCTVKGAADTAGTAFTGKYVEFFRAGHIIAVTPATAGASGGTLRTGFSWSAKDSGIMPIVGPSAQIGVWAAGQGGTGFITVIWAELDSDAII